MAPTAKSYSTEALAVSREYAAERASNQDLDVSALYGLHNLFTGETQPQCGGDRNVMAQLHILVELRARVEVGDVYECGSNADDDAAASLKTFSGSIKGVLAFGANIDTDTIIPGKF
ncbi:hypothetical protein F441_06913 [Phytophthora nicotianae CJ01A1]|nr:hypothetical protein F441_06913 [Phytophthora nicotianae CJ01A1]